MAAAMRRDRHATVIDGAPPETGAFPRFTVGESMTSLDNGETWIPSWMLPPGGPTLIVPMRQAGKSAQSARITAVARERGVVTISIRKTEDTRDPGKHL